MANEWKTFIQLIGEDKKWIGKVISSNPTSKKVEVLPIGNLTSIEVDPNVGAYATGSYVFVEGGIITGQAPQISIAYKEIIS